MSRTKDQVVWVTVEGEYTKFTFPAANKEVLPNVFWGRADEFGTPAFWKLQTILQRKLGRSSSHQLGDNLLEEVAACILGGYGIPAELGLAAFDRLRARALLDGHASADEIERALKEPLWLAGKPRMYRFISRKARHVASALATLRGLRAYRSDEDLRAILLRLPGVGPKTASWVVRNHLNSNAVAILDVHVVRACFNMGVFPVWANVAKHYYELERAFLEFCDGIDEPAAVVDALMWDYMRRVGATSRVMVR